MDALSWRLQVWKSICTRKCCWFCGGQKEAEDVEEKSDEARERWTKLKKDSRMQESPSRTWSVSSLPDTQVQHKNVELLYLWIVLIQLNTLDIMLYVGSPKGSALLYRKNLI